MTKLSLKEMSALSGGGNKLKCINGTDAVVDWVLVETKNKTIKSEMAVVDWVLIELRG